MQYKRNGALRMIKASEDEEEEGLESCIMENIMFIIII